MKFIRHCIIGVALLSCLSCIKVNDRIGGNLIPTREQYSIYFAEVPIEHIEMRMADSLSGYSQSKIAFGAIRDDLFGLSVRESAVTLVPLYDTLRFGNVQKINHFKLSAAFDTTSVSIEGNERILQRVFANEVILAEGAKISELPDANDCANLISHGSESIIQGTPILDGKNDLTLYFTEEYARKFLDTAEGLILSKDMETYLQKFPGVCLSTDIPAGNGGRINTFDVQMNYNSSQYYLESNYGELSINSIFEGKDEPVDTTFYFYYGAMKFTKLDSLITSYSNGTFPQYAVNICRNDSRRLEGAADEVIYVEGGAGIKPVITAEELRSLTIRTIQDTLLAHSRPSSDYTKAVLNKASIVLPFDLETDYKDLDNLFPPRLSPTCRIWTDTTSSYMGLTDASAENADQGDINRSTCVYSPDITYHLQQVMLKDEDDKGFATGNYDIWMLLMNIQTVTTSSGSSNSDMSEYLQYLAYQNYYNSMYGGYNSYGYSSSYYNNYYSYMLAAMYAGNSTSSTESYQLDKESYYRATLYGPNHEGRQKPTLKLTFSIPKE